jgi:hypothetical protein
MSKMANMKRTRGTEVPDPLADRDRLAPDA